MATGAAGLTDAIACAKGDATQARVAAPLDVRAIREAMHRSQDGLKTCSSPGTKGRNSTTSVEFYDQKQRISL